MKVSRRDFVIHASTLLASPMVFEAPALCGALPKPPSLPPHLAINDWIRIPRLVIAEGYTPPFYPIFDYDPDRAVALVKQLNGDSLRFPAAAYFAYFPTKTAYPIHPHLEGKDPLARTVELLHKHSMKAVAYLPLNHPFLDVNLHYPHIDDWLRRSSDGEPMITEHYGYARYYETCVNSPFRQVMLDLVSEVLTGYDVDVIYFDGPYQGMGQASHFCYCRFCQAAYHRDRAKEIPLQDRALDPEAEREYTLWMRDQICGGFVRDLRQLVRSTRDVPTLYNNSAWLVKRQWRSRAYEDLDGLMFEAAETPEQKLFNLGLGRSTGKTVWTYVGSYNQYNREHLKDSSVQGWFSLPVEGQELSLDGFVALGAGAGLVYWGLNRFFGLDSSPLASESGRRVRETFDLIDRHGDLLSSLKPAYQAGIVVGSQTIDWYQGRLFVPDAYPNYFYGAYSVLKDNGYDVEPFVDYALNTTDLSSYPLIYAPNIACLSESQNAALIRYVEAGGVLLATHLTSTADELGRPRADFGLASLLGASLLSPDSVEMPDLYVRPLPSGDLVPQDPQIVRFSASRDSRILAETWDCGHRRILGPAVVTGMRKNGRVIYIGSGLEAIYEETRMALVREYLRSLLDPVLNAHRTYQIGYQPGLMATFGSSHNALVLHLFVNSGNKWKKCQARELFVPVRQIQAKLRIPTGREVASVKLLRAGRNLPWITEGEWVKITVPQVFIYEAACVTLTS